jgi:hypothetical protein
MVRTDSALLDPRHILAAADADGAAFDPDGARVDLEEMSRVAVAVVDVVEPSRPVAGPVRHQAIENGDADQRPATVGGVGIVLVSPGKAGLRIDR